MTILHYFDDNDSIVARYVALLTQTIGTKVTMLCASKARDFKRLYAEQHPDIVHVHGQPQPSLPSDCRLVITPHGHTLPSMKAYVVVARSQMELNALKGQFKRVTIVRNPLVTRTTTNEECATLLMTIYQQVMDSNVLQLMSTQVRRAMAILLSAASRDDRRWVEPVLAPGSLSLTALDFRRLYIYTQHEGVLPLLQKGLRLFSMDAPEPQPIVSYLPDTFNQPQPMTGTSIIDLLRDVKANGPSLLRLSEIDSALHDNSLDETALMSQIDDKGLRPLLAATLNLLKDQLLLTEGFMPCPPASDRDSEPLRLQLEKRQDVMA